MRSPNPLRLDSVVTEVARRQQVGGPEVMREQLRHLLNMIELPHVSVQVCRSRRGLPGAELPVPVAQFPDPKDPPVACVEYPGGVVYVEDTDDVKGFILAFNGLTQQAIRPSESAELIRELAEGG
jgi:hypothetical protein